MEILADAFDQRTEIETHQIHLDADVSEILLDHGRHTLAGLVAGVCNDRKFHRMSFAVSQHAAIQPKTILPQSAGYLFWIEFLCFQLCVEPETVGRGNGA